MGFSQAIGLVNQQAALTAQATAVGTAGTICLGLFHRIREVWKFASKAFSFIDFTSTLPSLDTKQITRQAMGWGLTSLYKDWKVIRYPACLILIFNRVLNAIQQKKSLEIAFTHWLKFAYRGDYLTTINTTPSEKSSVMQNIFSPSSTLSFEIALAHLVTRIKMIATYSWNLLKEAFYFSMSCADLYDTYAESATIGDEAVNDLVINLNNIMGKNSQNKEEFIKFLETKLPFFDEVVEKLHLPCKGKDLIAVVKGCVWTLGGVHAVTEKVTEVTNKLICNTSSSLFNKMSYITKEGLTGTYYIAKGVGTYIYGKVSLLNFSNSPDSSTVKQTSTAQTQSGKPQLVAI